MIEIPMWLFVVVMTVCYYPHYGLCALLFRWTCSMLPFETPERWRM